MSKSLNFFILALLIMASIESKLISSTNAREESNPDASPSPNPAASPQSDDLSGLTGGITTYINDYLFECPPGGCLPSRISRFR